MAYTVSHLAKSVFGNKRVEFLRVTADDGTGEVDTGLTQIEGIMGYAPQSMTTAIVRLKINVRAAGTAAAGFLAVTTITSGDVFFVSVVGV
jgi:hypothetical protein